MIRALATDLDGTLIPLPSEPDHPPDLIQLDRVLQQRSITLLYATGRHPESVFHAMAEYQLPTPKWVICDVGTTIMKRSSAGKFESEMSYEEHLADLSDRFPADAVRQLCKNIKSATPQEQEKQGQFKVSFYTAVNKLAEARTTIQSLLKEASSDWSVISSIDPFTNEGLIDVLPTGVSKAHAIEWWRQNHGFGRHEIAYAGDSCNDLAALTAGYHGIVVANAAEDLREQLSKSSTQPSLFFATRKATGGVLEGVRAMISRENNT